MHLGTPLALAAALALAACAAEPASDAGAAPPAEVPAAAAPPAEVPGAALPPDGSGAEADGRLRAEGWGPLRIGMTREEVVAAAGEDANPGAVGGPEPERCDEFRPERAPDGMLVMLENGRLTRITVSEAGVRTDRGFGVGDPAAEVAAAYGAAAERSPHKYVEAPAEYITVWASGAGTPAARGIVYEVGGEGRVQHVHAGGPSIAYVEGCL